MPQEDLLVVTIEREGGDPDLESGDVLDEVRDCTIAAFDFASGRIDFGVLEARTVKSTDPTNDALPDARP